MGFFGLEGENINNIGNKDKLIDRIIIRLLVLIICKYFYKINIESIGLYKLNV